MESGSIVRAFIASPTDATILSDDAVKVIADWNAANSYSRKFIIEPVRGATHTRAAQGDNPQVIISGQLIKRCDFLIGIFRHRIGTKTQKSDSGTIQEIEDFSATHSKDRVMLFFSTEPVQQGLNEEFEKLRNFKAAAGPDGYHRPFDNPDDFRQKLKIQIDLTMNSIIQDANSDPARMGDEGAEWVNTSYGTVIRRVAGRDWIEEEANGSVCRFKLVEVAREKNFVELYNAVKDEMWRIGEKTMHRRQITSDKWLANGLWRKADKNSKK